MRLDRPSTQHHHGEGRRGSGRTSVGLSLVPHFNFPRLANRIFHCLVVRASAAIWGVHRADQGRQSTHTTCGTTPTDMRRKHGCHETVMLMYLICNARMRVVKAA